MPDEIDRLLDEALSEYAAAPDRPGLEERVLARVHQRNRGLRRWLFSASAAAAVLTAALIVLPLRVTEKPSPSIKVIEVVRKYTASPKVQQAVFPPKAVPHKRHIRRRYVDPKRPEFPTPTPLTPPERALLEIAKFQPAQLEALSRPMKPLDVSLIQIEPLDEEEK